MLKRIRKHVARKAVLHLRDLDHAKTSALNSSSSARSTGARACPPEDSGGPYGYADLLEILAKPRHKEYRQMREWAGKNFDPEKFSAKAANFMLNQALPKGPKLNTVQIQ